MKTITIAMAALLLGAVLTMGCGSTTTGSTGGTETGSTTDTSKLADNINSVASALVPNINSDSGGASVSAAKSVTYADESNWATYTDPSNNNVLTDIFGSADVDPMVVTKIRVLLDQFSNTVSGIFARDPDITCTSATALNEGDTIDIAFYGTTANGSSADRHFSCISTESDATTLYGRDSSGVVRIATMSDNTSTNTELPLERGDEMRIRVVVYATYAEQTEEGSTVSYLDLNFAHITSYNGPDNDFATTDDNMIFKSRSRITGRAALDASGIATLGTGDFNVTKYDQTGSGPELITRTIGRGSYSAADYVLFNVDSNTTAVASLPGIYCIQIPSDASGLPTSAATSNCTALEDAPAWGGATFPFDVLPAIDADFSTKTFYEDDGSGLITNDGSNFSIPTYH